MRILGLGVDPADIEGVGRVLEKCPRFAERCFTKHEREDAFRFAGLERRLAARFAGKEAVMKSKGTGWRWYSLDRHRNHRRRPFVGAAGLLLDELLAGIDVVQLEVYIANVLKCRPASFGFRLAGGRA